MKLSISRQAARAAGITAAAARVFYALAVEGGTVHNGVWLSALLGALAAAVLPSCLLRLRRRDGSWPSPVKVPLTAILFLAALIDSGLVLSAIARSSSFLAMDRVPLTGLAIPVALALFWCVSRNGDAVGYGAMLWTRIFPALLLLVAILQWRHYRPQWLLPLLGNGWRSIGNGCLRTVCCFLPVVALPTVCEDAPEGSGGRGLPAALLSLGAVLAALLLLLRLMMAPTAPSSDWSARLDTLLTNGRAPLYLQLPMIVVWYAGLMHLLACEGFVAALLLQRLLPGLDGRFCASMVALVALGIAHTALPSTLPNSVLPVYLLLAVAVLAVLSLAATTIKAKGGKSRCAG